MRNILCFLEGFLMYTTIEKVRTSFCNFFKKSLVLTRAAFICTCTIKALIFLQFQLTLFLLFSNVPYSCHGNAEF